jgi:hypothetical protein
MLVVRIIRRRRARSTTTTTTGAFFGRAHRRSLVSLYLFVCLLSSLVANISARAGRSEEVEEERKQRAHAI